MQLSDALLAGLIWGAAGIGLAMFVPPLRSLLGWACGEVWKGFLSLLHLLMTLAQTAVRNVLSAHFVILRNLGPRNSVLPSVRPRQVKRVD